MSYDFKELNAQLLLKAESVLYDWFPSGKLNGNEFTIGDLSGAPGKSLSVNIKTGVWKDFAAGDGGADLIALYAASRSLTQAEAFSDLKGLQKPKAKKIIKEKKQYIYNSSYSMNRIDFEDGSKTFYPLYNGKKKQHPEPRPLYNPNFGLDDAKGVLIVEGEKACQAAEEVLGQIYKVMTWPGGSNAVSKADWEQVPAYLPVILWPDCDEAGIKAMTQVAMRLKTLNPDQELSILDPRKDNILNGNDGWDAYEVCRYYKKEKKDIVAWCKRVKIDPQTLPKPPESPTVTKNNAIIQSQTEEHIEKFPDAGKVERVPDQPSNMLEIKGCNLMSTDSGKPLSNTANFDAIFRGHSKYKDKLYFDYFNIKTMFYDDKLKSHRPQMDLDAIDAVIFLERKIGMKNVPKAKVEDAILSCAMSDTRSAPSEWLNSLEWDKTPRLHTLFTEYIKSTMDPEYLEAVSKNFLVSMVARIERPGCQVDNMVVLESRKQGTLKTSALRVLAGDDWYSSMTSRIGTKGFLEEIRGKWLIEMEELKCFKGAGTEEQKQAISSRSDTFRVSYGRHSADFKRQCVFVGTTNKDDYIDDDSGSRRFWPIKVDSIDLPKLKQDREQLFAEAMELLANNYKYWVVPEEAQQRYTDSRNIAISSRHPWHDVIEDFTYSLKDTTRDGWLTSNSILEDVLDIPLKDRKRSHTLTVTKVLKALGYANSVKRVGERVYKVWSRPHHTQEAIYKTINIQP
jgi:predicted P-loop ATPase